MLFNLRFMMVSLVKIFWNYEDSRTGGHSALAELPIYQEYAHGRAMLEYIFATQIFKPAYGHAWHSSFSLIPISFSLSLTAHTMIQSIMICKVNLVSSTASWTLQTFNYILCKIDEDMVSSFQKLQYLRVSESIVAFSCLDRTDIQNISNIVYM